MDEQKEIKIVCPNCLHSVIERNNKEKKLFMKSGNVLKSKIIFLNDDGTVNIKCKSCDKVIKVPLKVEFTYNS